MNKIIPENKNPKLESVATIEKPIKITYFMDPICSSCWSIEPQLRRLMHEYGHLIEIEYKMGGLLENINDPNGPARPNSEIAQHWNELGEQYLMHIDGDIWLEDPVHSSYPPSIAFKAAELQDKKKSIEFLRELREMIFLFKKNIAKMEVIEEAALISGLDVEQLKKDMNVIGKALFYDDLSISKKLSIVSFPTMFFSNQKGLQEMLSGPKNYETYEQIILKLNPGAEKNERVQDVSCAFSQFKSFTIGEMAEFCGLSIDACQKEIELFNEKGTLRSCPSKHGILWKSR